MRTGLVLSRRHMILISTEGVKSRTSVDHALPVQILEGSGNQSNPDPARNQANYGLHEPNVFLHRLRAKPAWRQMSITFLYRLGVEYWAGKMKGSSASARISTLIWMPAVCFWQSHDYWFPANDFTANGFIFKREKREADVDSPVAALAPLRPASSRAKTVRTLGKRFLNSRRIGGSMLLEAAGMNPRLRRPTSPWPVS